ncbi:MAG: hypothetical protein KDD10_12520 [Phaeodactylibacter sp.]|nr:hypothetical protein [Phaeodactylibacter sp.]MCB9295385.1 hypothetical protein [Lewinellaceae bacterium]
MLRFCTLLTLFFSFVALCHSSSCPIEIEGELWICPGEATVLTAANGFSEYYWNNGQKGRSITAGPGSYRVVGRTEDGCIGIAEFQVREMTLPQAFDLKVLGSSRVDGDNWVGSRYAVHPYHDFLEYFWMLDGDTLSQGHELEIDTLPIRSYQLGVSAYSPCTGLSVSSFWPLVPYEGDAGSVTVFSCSQEPPYYYLAVPLPEEGLYDILAVNQVGLQVGLRRHVVVEPQYATSYDTVTLCGNTPLNYSGTIITQPGSYAISISNNFNFGCRELVHLEVLEALEQPLSLETVEHCGSGWFEHNGEYYNMPGLYERAYPRGNGCDSLAFTFVEYTDEVPGTDIYAEICPGEMYHHNGISYSEAGEYVRTYNLASGCDSVVTLHLSILENPEIETHHYFCHGESILVNGTLFTESGMLEYVAPGQGEACDSIVTAHVQELAPIEIADQALTPDDGGQAGSIEISAQGGLPPYAYEWSNGATTEDISQLAAGSYSLTITDAAGCSAGFTFILDLVSGTGNSEPGKQLTLGPNPFRDRLQLFGQAGLEIPNPMLYLYDVTGRLALRLPFTGGAADVPSSLPAGLYWYRLQSAGQVLAEGKLLRQ